MAFTSGGDEDQPKPAVEGCEVYQYEKLKPKHIRLFKLLPPCSDGIIRCEIVHDAFTRPNETEEEMLVFEYAALSYNWGPRTPLRRIQVNNRCFEIRENLWHFLNRLQSHAQRPKHLWADAVCINQDDVSEKTSQVALMGQIFSGAKEVFI